MAHKARSLKPTSATSSRAHGPLKLMRASVPSVVTQPDKHDLAIPTWDAVPAASGMFSRPVALAARVVKWQPRRNGLASEEVDRLGDRLRSNEFTDADLELLNAYRSSFVSAYGAVVEILRNALKLEPSGRPAKSTSSIADKLRREGLRLRQMQDIAGCRVIVGDVVK